jgi:hypothetical protein
VFRPAGRDVRAFGAEALVLPLVAAGFEAGFEGLLGLDTGSGSGSSSYQRKLDGLLTELKLTSRSMTTSLSFETPSVKITDASFPTLMVSVSSSEYLSAISMTSLKPTSDPLLP